MADFFYHLELGKYPRVAAPSARLESKCSFVFFVPSFKLESGGWGPARSEVPRGWLSFLPRETCARIADIHGEGLQFSLAPISKYKRDEIFLGGE